MGNFRRRSNNKSFGYILLFRHKKYFPSAQKLERKLEKNYSHTNWNVRKLIPYF